MRKLQQFFKVFFSVLPLLAFGQSSDSVNTATGLGIQHSWLTTCNILHPRGNYDRKHVNIDVLAVSVAKAWRYRNGVEFQVIATLVQADGVPYRPNGGRSTTNWAGGSMGVVMRMNYIDTKTVRAFLDFNASYLITNYALPWESTPRNAFLLTGPGIEFTVQGPYSAEMGLRWAHVSNANTYSVNSAWNGGGIYVSIRRRV